MNINKINDVTLGAVHTSTFIKINNLINKINLLVVKIGFIFREKEMIGYEYNNRSYREIAYHFVR